MTQKSVSKLQRGMTKQQIQSLLGTPLMRDNFNSNRWDYVFYQNKQDNDHKPQNITLIFQNDLLVNVSN
ncbi:MAG: outer membrane protein assembly factor BamE [Cocleimonas sp.]|nr:outer membrane protein assembly factor BamE [Cocleimonas sp.]